MFHFCLSDSLQWEKAIRHLKHKPGNEWINDMMVRDRKSEVQFHINVLGDKGTTLQHVIVEFLNKIIRNLGIDIRVEETKKINGPFDLKLSGAPLDLDLFFTRFMDESVDVSSGKVHIEVKCISLNDCSYNKKWTDKTQKTIVDVQRIKKDKFSILILATHFENTMNVYMGQVTKWKLSSNGKSEDRGMRYKFTSEHSLRSNRIHALDDIHRKISEYMHTLCTVELS